MECDLFVIFDMVYWYPLQDHEIIEAKIGEYEHALNRAAEVYREIQQLVMTQNNDYSLNVMTTLTTCTINFKSLVEQTGTGWKFWTFNYRYLLS